MNKELKYDFVNSREYNSFSSVNFDDLFGLLKENKRYYLFKQFIWVAVLINIILDGITRE